MTMAADKQDKVLNVPNLRFPEFNGEWVKYRVSDVLDFYSTNSLSWDQLEYNTDELQNLHYGLIHVGLPTVVNLDENVLPNIKKEFLPKNYELCREGDVAFADASEDTNEVAKAIEFVNLSDKNVVCGLHTIHGRDNHNLTSIGFKGYSFASESFHNQIRRIAQGTKIFSIGSKNFNECYMGIPSKDEQTKIAKLLALIDERISTQSRIIEDLKSERKYLLEQLFCLPNERVPKLRLKGMTGEWQKVKLCYIANRVTEKNKANTCNRVLTIAAQYGLIDQQEFFNKQIASSDLTTYYLLHKGDFAYNKSYSGDYSWGAVKRLDKYDKGVLSSLYICFRPNENVDSDFLCHYFESTKWYRGISEISGEGARNHGLLNMSVDDYFNTLHRIPTLREQKAVANALNVLVDKIDIETEILNDLQKQKSYLLKEMFI